MIVDPTALIHEQFDHVDWYDVTGRCAAPVDRTDRAEVPIHSARRLVKFLRKALYGEKTQAMTIASQNVLPSSNPLDQ